MSKSKFDLDKYNTLKVEGYTLKQIAIKLGMSEGSLRNALAKKKISLKNGGNVSKEALELVNSVVKTKNKVIDNTLKNLTKEYDNYTQEEIKEAIIKIAMIQEQNKIINQNMNITIKGKLMDSVLNSIENNTLTKQEMIYLYSNL